MASPNSMFLFEVMVENVKSMVESRFLVIKSDFANIFSLELKDPKQLHIVMPEPLPLPPEPVSKKKGKKKKKPKPKKGKKKGKKGKPIIEEPPPEPSIQSGQSVLFSSNAEVLIENMKKCPLEVSLWNKEDNLVFIGTTRIPWDPIFLIYLENILNCKEPPPVVLKDEYNIFEEGRARLMAKLSIQVKLSYLADKVTTAFRTLSEDPTVKKFLYTGINSKTTSYMCTLKTTDEYFEENCNKVENKFIKDKPKPVKINYADYKNAPGANLAFFDENDYCCLSHADKPPESIYKSPETCPDIDFIIDYVRKIIVSCNDNMRMLTPRPTIRPRVKATDIDRLCYCRETAWPKSTLAERFKQEAQSGPCPICIDAGKKVPGSRGTTFDIANIRGPCGRPECRIARAMRAYIENLVDEDNVEFNLNDLIGPCGTKECIITEKIQDFLRHEGVFTHGATLEGTSTQCACMEKMKESLTKKSSCSSICSKDCENSTSESEVCEGKGCPYKKNDPKVYDVYYFTVHYDFQNESDKDPADPASGGNESDTKSKTSGPIVSDSKSKTSDGNESDSKSKASSKSPEQKYKFCGRDCPSMKASEKTFCSKTMCSIDIDKLNDYDPESWKCMSPVCTNKNEFPPSPADSNIEMKFREITNPCCVKSCDIAERVKDFIVDGVTKKNKCNLHDNPCYCDCECTFKFSRRTTYCAVCGGYECLGDDMRDQPEFIKPHPCPVYHKLYDRKYIDVKSPWPEEEQKKEAGSTKSSKGGSKTGDKNDRKSMPKTGKLVPDKKGVSEKKGAPDKKSAPEKTEVEEKVKKKKKEKKRKSAKVADQPAQAPVEKKIDYSRYRYPYPLVPKYMGWNWAAEDIPGLKPRPKWRPGASNKILVRRYRAVKEGQDSVNKKKRALMQRKKKIEMKPTLVVTKKDGEFTVQMEVFKKYSKERLLFQYPYDEKPPLVYTIGKTAEEKCKIQKQRDRRERRETRRKSRLLQSTFRDRCQEICLKAYNQAIGLLPLPNPNAPHCPCHTKPFLSATPPIIDSCSCSDIGTISSSDTDNDEWVIEFTPPLARWDAKAKHPQVLVEDESQYNYLDYKVKLFDKTGNPVPRFFKGPDGKQECSDLGGFWSPNKVWLEINKDGYIGVDNRWVPMNFIGPDGLYYSAEEGTFTDNAGELLKIGIDGYIDKDGKWAWYSKKKGPKSTKSKSTASASTVDAKKGEKSPADASTRGKTDVKGKGEPAWTSPVKAKSTGEQAKSIVPPQSSPVNVGKVAKNLDKIKKCVTLGEKAEKTKNPIVMSASVNYNRNSRQAQKDRKAHVDPKKLAKYQEIIEELKVYDDLGEFKPQPKANRASNTPRKKLSPFTMQGTVENYEKRTRSFRGLEFIDFGTSTTSSRGSPMYKSTLDNSLT